MRSVIQYSALSTRVTTIHRESILQNNTVQLFLLAFTAGILLGIGMVIGLQ